MKPLPKEFQFKCDEHSREQCEKLGIDILNFNLDCAGEYYHCNSKKLNFKCPDLFNETKYPLISLSDYLESEITHEKSLRLLKDYISETSEEEVKKIVDYYNNLYSKQPDHSDLIVKLTGQYVAGILADRNSYYKNDTELCLGAIALAELTVKQLKERRYLK